MVKIGEAYGFFYYADETSRILDVLPDIREGTETPVELTLDLVEGVDKLNTEKDSKLVDIVQQAKRQHMSHVLKANLPSMGNRRTANFLGNIMNGINTALYVQPGTFCAEIIYKKGEKYIFRSE